MRQIDGSNRSRTDRGAAATPGLRGTTTREGGRRSGRLGAAALVLFLVAAATPAQDSEGGNGTAAGAGEAGAAVEIPRGFDTIELGTSREDVQELLESSSYFRYRGDPDVSLLPVGNRSVIETEGRSFIDRAFFQFSAEALYIIILQLNQVRMDHYSVYQTLTEKYGEPLRVSPGEIVWQWEEVTLSLERPLTVKYVDRPVFEELRGQARAEQSLRELSRDQFLEDL